MARGGHEFSTGVESDELRGSKTLELPSRFLGHHGVSVGDQSFGSLGVVDGDVCRVGCKINRRLGSAWDSSLWCDGFFDR